MNALPNNILTASERAEVGAAHPSGHGAHEHCADCLWYAKCVVASLPAQQPLSFITRIALSARQTLCREGDTFSSVYVVRSGTLKSLITSEDGRQQIVGIHLPAETIGTESIATGRRSRTVIAVEKSEICMVGFAGLNRLMCEIPATRRWFQRALGDEMARSGETTCRLRRTSAEERIASFLLDLSRRLSASTEATPEFTLSPSRVDIAIHLGLTRETVSRAFAKLRRLHLIEGDLTRVRLCDPHQLGSLAASRASPVGDARTRRETTVRLCRNAAHRPSCAGT
jgi:CRP/FNR family transcriptional regulator